MNIQRVISLGRGTNGSVRLEARRTHTPRSGIYRNKTAAFVLICIAFTIPLPSFATTAPPAASVNRLQEQINTVTLMDEMLKLDKGIKQYYLCTKIDYALSDTKSAMDLLNADTSLSDAEYSRRYEAEEQSLENLKLQYKKCFSDNYKTVSGLLKLTSVLQFQSLGYDGFEKKYIELKSRYYEPNATINYKEELKELQGRQDRLILNWLEKNIQEVRDFRGLDDPKISRSSWRQWVKLHITKLVDTANSYNGIHSEIVIPGETMTDQKDGILRGYLRNAPLVSLTAGEGKLVQLLSGHDLPPGHRDNPYAAITAQTEQPLQQAILHAAPHSLFPENVLKLALDVCDGNYPLAVTTGHAVLKIATYEGRSVLKRMFARARGNKWDSIPDLAKSLKPHSDIAKRLHNLRPGDDTTGDKLGPWYHGFGLLTAGALSSPEGAHIGAKGEHTSKWLGWFIGEGDYNPEKEYTDEAFSDITFRLRKYGRFYDPSQFE